MVKKYGWSWYTTPHGETPKPGRRHPIWWNTCAFVDDEEIFCGDWNAERIGRAVEDHLDKTIVWYSEHRFPIAMKPGRGMQRDDYRKVYEIGDHKELGFVTDGMFVRPQLLRKLRSKTEELSEEEAAAGLGALFG